MGCKRGVPAARGARGNRGANRKIVYEMVKAGKSVKAIMDETGLSSATVRLYRSDLMDEEGVLAETMECKKGWTMPPGFDREWTCAVNRIRRYCGMTELPMSVTECIWHNKGENIDAAGQQ